MCRDMGAADGRFKYLTNFFYTSLRRGTKVARTRDGQGPAEGSAPSRLEPRGPQVKTLWPRARGGRLGACDGHTPHPGIAIPPRWPLWNQTQPFLQGGCGRRPGGPGVLMPTERSPQSPQASALRPCTLEHPAGAEGGVFPGPLPLPVSHQVGGCCVASLARRCGACGDLYPPCRGGRGGGEELSGLGPCG